MPTEELQVCTFVVANLLLGLRVTDVSEVVRGEDVTPVPLAPDAVVGLLNLRGRIVPAVDARTRLGLPPRSPDEEAAHVVVNVGDEQVSLVVDRTSDVVTLSPSEREDVPDTVAEDIRRLLVASYQRPDALLLLLDPMLVLFEP